MKLEIEKRDYAELIQKVLTVGAPWTPMELEIEKNNLLG